MNKRILAAFTAIAVAASTLTFMSFAADDSNTKDGIPVLSGTFEESADYPSANEPPLGIANVFHLFAFNDIELNAHCNGNFAAPTVDASKAANGTNQNDGHTGTNPEVVGEVSLATVKLSIANTTKVDKLLIPMDHIITDAKDPGNFMDELSENERPVTKDGKVVGQIKIGTILDNNKYDTHLVDMNGSTVAFIDKSYVDFAGYKTMYTTLSNDLAALNGTATSTDVHYITVQTDSNNDNGEGTIKLADSGVSVLNITLDDLNKYKNSFNIENVKVVDDNDGDGRVEYPMAGNTSLQTLIINLNTETADNVSLETSLNIVRTNGTKVDNTEENVYDGTNILWNIYNSENTENGQYTGTFTFTKSTYGSVIAPYASITTAGAGLNGNIIANNITINNESHRCDFIGKLPVTLKKPTSTTTTPEESSGSSQQQPEQPQQPEQSGSEGDEQKPTTDVTTDEPTSSPTPAPSTDPKPESSTDPSTGTDPDGDGNEQKPAVTTAPQTTPDPTPTTGGNEDVADEGDENDKTTTTPADTTTTTTTTAATTPDSGVGNDGDENGKTTTTPAETTPTTTTTTNNEGVANGGDGNDRDSGIGNDGDENNRPSNSAPSSPKTGDSAPAALAVVLIGSALVITAAKKGKDK